MGLDLTYCAPDALMATSQVPLTPPLVPRHLGPTRSLTELPIFCPKPDLRLSHTMGNDTAISLQKPEPRILFPPQTPPWTCKAAVPHSPPRGRARPAAGLPPGSVFATLDPFAGPGCGLPLPPHPQDLVTRWSRDLGAVCLALKKQSSMLRGGHVTRNGGGLCEPSRCSQPSKHMGLDSANNQVVGRGPGLRRDPDLSL